MIYFVDRVLLVCETVSQVVAEKWFWFCHDKLAGSRFGKGILEVVVGGVPLGYLLDPGVSAAPSLLLKEITKAGYRALFGLISQLAVQSTTMIYIASMSLI